MNKKDLLLTAAVLVLAGIFAAVFCLQPHKKPVMVTATVDGEVYGAWDLSADLEVDIDTEYGHNHLSIRDGSAQITEADCPDGLCMHQGTVREGGEMNVCLPHHLIVEVLTEGDESYDGLSQ